MRNIATDTRYVYDALGRLDAVEAHARVGDPVDTDPNLAGAQPEVTDYVYDLAGNLAQTRGPVDPATDEQLVTDYQYDALNRLDVLRHFRDTNVDFVYTADTDVLVSEFDYTVRADGKRTQVVETLPHDSDGNGSTDTTVTNQVDWIYDRLGRLIQEDFDWDTTPGEDSLDFTADYIFDLVGNRKEKHVDNGRDAVVDEIFTYEYDLNDRLLTELKDVDGWADDRLTVYGYDGTQQTSKSVHATETDDGAGGPVKP